MDRRSPSQLSPPPTRAQFDIEDADPDETSEHATLLRSARQARSLRPGGIVVGGYKLPRPHVLVLTVPFVVLIVIVLFHRHEEKVARSRPLLSNGTHTFYPTTLVVSLDGFKPAYLTERAELVPNILSLGKDQGIRAESMQPCFPSLTFPNHWSLLTGLYPESHGIIANDFWAKELDEEFHFNHPSSLEGRWWGGEPLWAVAERAGRRAANIMWPGPPTDSAGTSPSFFVQYKKVSPQDKLDTLRHYLDLDIEEAPSLIFSYMPELDQAGHRGGPDSSDVEEALKLVDGYIGDVVAEIEARNLTHIVDLIVLSDHGMTGLSKQRIIFMDDILGDDFTRIKHRDGWPSFGLHFEKDEDVQPVLAKLKEASTGEHRYNFTAYTPATMPERWHFSHGPRIAPVYIVPDLGWIITDREEYDRYEQGNKMVKGCHGFDNREPDMQAIFFARGPFATRLRESVATSNATKVKGWKSIDPPILEPFRNLEIYDLVLRLQNMRDFSGPTNSSKIFWDNYFEPPKPAGKGGSALGAKGLV